MPNGKTAKELGYEVEDVGWKFVLWSLGILTVVTIVSIFMLLVVFGYRDSYSSMADQTLPVTAEERPIPGGPLLQAQPPVDMATYKAEALKHINGYGWVDESAGKAHIPIERAMELALEQGFAAGAPVAAPEQPIAEQPIAEDEN